MTDPSDFIDAGSDLFEECLAVPGAWAPDAPGIEMYEQIIAGHTASENWIRPVFERIAKLPPEQQLVAAESVVVGLVGSVITFVLEARWRLAPPVIND